MLRTKLVSKLVKLLLLPSTAGLILFAALGLWLSRLWLRQRHASNENSLNEFQSFPVRNRNSSDSANPATSTNSASSTKTSDSDKISETSFNNRRSG